MNAQSILEFLKHHRIAVEEHGGELSLQAPKGVLDAQMIAALKANKVQIIAAIRDGYFNQVEPADEPPPLAAPSPEELERIAQSVAYGAANIQDVYPLTPLQQGILFHHMLDGEGDPYLLRSVLGFGTRQKLDRFLQSIQAVIDRHDILRTSVHWEGLPEPMQVVQRRAVLPVIEWAMQGAMHGTAMDELLARTDPHRTRLDLRHGPLMAAHIIEDPEHGEWLLSLLSHHLIGDHVTLDLMMGEVALLLCGREDALPPTVPFRRHVAQTRAIPAAEHDSFFLGQLGDIDEPTAPFGVLNVYGDAGKQSQATVALPAALSSLLRECARQLGVNVAVLFHVAWAMVLGRCTGRTDVVFGTVLSGRLQTTGTERMMGMLINTLPIRISLGGASVEEVVRDTYQRTRALLEHEQASLAAAQGCSGVKPPMPLFTSLLNYRHSERSQHDDRASFEGIRLHSALERTNYPLTMNIDDFGDGFALNTKCTSTISAERMNVYLATALDGLARALSIAPRQPMKNIDVLPAAERMRLLFGLNDTGMDYLVEVTFPRLFEQQVERTPHATALVFNDQHMTYAQLNAQANRLAHHLIALGVGIEDRVVICLEREIAMIVALLAALKAGAAYVPLDPSQPTQRLSYMVQDSAPSAIITQRSARSLLGEVSVPIIDTDDEAWLSHGTDNPSLPRLNSRSLAYVIYTSGSTGRPKGVMVEHRSLVNYLHAVRALLEVTADDRVLALTTLSFDIAAMEIYLPLMCGAQMVMAGREQARDMNLLADVIEQYGITIMQATPATWRMLVNHGWQGRAGLKAYCGGEALSPALARRLLERADSVWNAYGPTETTIYSSVDRVLDDGATDISTSVGSSIANTQIYVLDSAGRPAPIGVVGEIHIGGIGVARGYFRRPGLTAERFVPNPFHGGGRDRMYKTGDLGYRRPDGGIEFLGRNDFQVKIRGHRIELGEIETQLTACPGVREAVVVAREGTPGDKRLVAYIVAHPASEPTPASLRALLERQLPLYMLPAAYVMLPALPQTSNGKVDRNALPAPTYETQSRPGFEVPEGEVEQALAKVWRDVMRLEKVGRWDNFYELGGDSIVAMQIVSLARGQGIAIGVRDILENLCIAKLAQQHHAAALQPASQHAVTGRFSPLPIHLEHLAPDIEHSNHFNMSVLLHVPERFGMQDLLSIMSALFQRHDALRIRFRYEEGSLVAWHVDPDSLLVQAACIEEKLADHADGFAAALLHRCEQLQQSLHLTDGPLFRAILFCGNAGERRLWLLAHHAIFDAISWRVFLIDLDASYSSVASGQPIGLPAKTSSYQAWGDFLRKHAISDELEQELPFWAGQFRHPGIAVPTGRAAISTASMTWADIDISQDDTHALLTCAPAAFDAQTQELLAAAVYAGVQRWARSPGLLMRMEHHGREGWMDRLDLTQTIGFFTASYPLYFHCDSEDIEAIVASIRDTMRAVPNNGIGYGLLKYLANAPALAGREIDMRGAISFNYLGRFDTSAVPAGHFALASEATGNQLDRRRHFPYLLGIQGGVWSGQLRLRIDYSSLQYAAEDVHALAAQIEQAVRRLVTAAQLAVERKEEVADDYA